MSLKPSSRPKMTRDQAEKIIAHFGIDRDKFPVCVVAVRGYYLDSMGVKGKNDRGIFDDAAAVVTPDVFVTVNWNTDASRVRAGRGKGAEKGMAMLDVGVWDYQIGKHKGRGPAGVQAGDVRVLRDGPNGTSYPDVGKFGINHHWGSDVGTSSLGCQTSPPDQWPLYINPIVSELARHKKKVYKYILITEEMRRAILEKDQQRIQEEAREAIKESTDPVRPNLQAALDIIKEFEGCILEAYKDPVGIWTIGYGTIRYPNGRAVAKGDRITKEQAQEYLLHEVEEKALAVAKAIKVPISDNEFCALVSFAYNCGVGAFQGSTLLRKLNAGASRIEVADELLKWVKAGGRVLNGLVRRRKAERTLFLTDDVIPLA